MEAETDGDRRAMRLLLPPLVLGAMLNPLNSTMLSTALTKLTHSFGRDVSAGALLITPLYLTAMIGQPLMGRLADLYSPKRVNYLGLVLVLAAVVVGVFAPSFGWLIVSRVLLGLGTSANYPSAIAILRRYYTERGKLMPANALGWIALGGMVSMVLGPMVGGFLTDWWGWRGIFLINVPLVLLVGLLSRALPEEAPVRVEKKKGDGFALVRLFKGRPIVALIYIQSTAAVSSLWVSRRAGPLLTKWLAVLSAIIGSLSLFVVHAGSSLVVVIGVSMLIGLITGFNPIANQASLNETVPPELSGFSFGLYRTFVYLGAVGSGALLKYIFHKGVTDASFRQIAWFALYSSLIMSILYLPLLLRRLGRRGEVGSGVETAS